MINILLMLSSILYIAVLIITAIYLMRISRFYVFFIGVEYFYFFGLGLYPLLLSLDLISTPDYYFNYSDINSLSLLTPVHIIAYSVGILLALFCKSLPVIAGRFLLSSAKYLYASPKSILIFFFLLNVVSFLILVAVYGFDSIVSSSAARRSGDFDFSQGVGQLAFLTRFMVLSLFIVCVYPYFVSERRNVFFVTMLIFFVGVNVYLFTVSRYALFFTFVMSMLIFWSYNKHKLMVNFYAIGMLVFGGFVIVFGKSFVSYVGSFYNEGSVKLHDNDFDTIILHFSHLLYSVDSGIKSFMSNGPYVGKDIILAPLGLVPSSIFSSLGLSDFSYQFLLSDQKTSCINSAFIGVSGCSIPPYYTGVSSYLLPVSGGLIFGFLRASLFIGTAKAWRYLELNSNMVRYVPILLILFVSIEQLMLFIPNTISLVVFLLVIMFFYSFIKRIKAR